MANAVHKLGQTVRINDGREGIVRYVGVLHIADGGWVGLELPDASGKNDGSVKGERYFACKPGHGIFVREGAIQEILKQPATTTGPKANGNLTGSGTGSRPRPSSGVSAEAARRRQSLMSNGSGSATGSRLSTRSPTKSPIKPTSGSASSAASTPRTGTPSATAKPTLAGNRTKPAVGGRPSVGPVAGTTRPPTHTTRPSIGNSSGLRSSTTVRPATQTTRTNISGTRLSQHARTISGQEKTPTKTAVEPKREQRTQSVSSPTIEEEEENTGTNRDMPNIDQVVTTPDEGQDPEPLPEEEPNLSQQSANVTKAAAAPRAATAGNVETRTAQQREIEQLKAKVRTLEKQRQEDREKLKGVQTLEDERDRYKDIMQALQKKLRTNQQDLADCRRRIEEAEARASAVPERSGELESELELATLDKEMAEERAETYQTELEVLKAKHEELELEVDVLREENTELTSTMSPEEKASAGWLQMEKERERLREALIKLRDMSQENETDLKAEISELRDNLDEAEKTAGLYVDAAEKLSRAEETNKHLMGQLEAVESNDEVVEAMELQRERNMETIEQLRNQIQDLEESLQVTDELEIFHVDEEKRLHVQLDECEALLSESQRRIIEQDVMIEDLEYTTLKFRDMVHGLQSDIDELRRSRDISESQANEMSSKSRAMMDLNLRLQNNAAKTQTKTIETELTKMKAELAEKHVNILNLFTPENFDLERKPIMALLSFGRIRSKADLTGRLLGERLRERSHLSNGEEVFRIFETMERMEQISKICYRFERFMNTCETQAFIGCGSALAELDPVERDVTIWIESLKKDELASSEPEYLKRMQGVLTDLSEKLIAESIETKATEMLMQAGMTEKYAEILNGQLTAMTRTVQHKLGGPSSEREESLVFDKKMDQLVTKARTVKYLTGKVAQQLDNLYSSSLCLEETSWILFEEMEHAAEVLTRSLQTMGIAISEEVTKLDSEDSVSYTSISEIMVSAIRRLPDYNKTEEDPFLFLSSHLASLQAVVVDLQAKTSDLNNTIEFEPLSPPWTIRAKEIKSTKVVAPEVQDELHRLERRNVELGSRIAEREKTIDEMGMRVEIAEKRFKESREKDNKDKAIQEELEHLKSELKVNDNTLNNLRQELATAAQHAEATQTELETLRKAADGPNLATTTAASHVGEGGQFVDESLVKQFELEAGLLQAEITSLQAAIRYLREENKNLRIPISEVLINSAKNSWLDGNIARRQPTPEETRRAKLEREGIDVWTGLIDVAKNIRPVRLGSKANVSSDGQKQILGQKPGTWQPVSQTKRYTVLKQREELEKWEAWRGEFLGRAKISSANVRGSRTRTKVGRNGVPRIDGSNLITAINGTFHLKDRMEEVKVDNVAIVES